MTSWIPYVSTFVPPGLQLIVGAVYIGSNIRTTVQTVSWASEWVKWGLGYEDISSYETDDIAWQYIEPDDEFIIECSKKGSR